MPEIMNIVVVNNLCHEKRDLIIYHHSTRGTHIISHGSRFSLPFKTGIHEGDYLLVSVNRGPGDLWDDCVVNVPSWLGFDITAQRRVSVAHGGSRTLVVIPPGPPNWELKLLQSNENFPNCSQIEVTIGDE